MATQQGHASLLFVLDGGSLTGTPKSIPPEAFQELGVLEVSHIEKWIDARPEVLGEPLVVITNQLAGFDKTKERLDLLALDQAGKLVVIELKRDSSGSRQDLQALRYAAYCSTLTLDDVLDLYVEHHSKAGESLSHEDARAALDEHVVEGALESLSEDVQPRIVLVAKTFRVELTATVLWLRENYDLDISCVELVPYKLDSSLLLSSSVRIPLPEAADYTVKRDHKRQTSRPAKHIDFERAKEIMAEIPPGYWMSYQQLAVAAGGSPAAGMAMGQYLAREVDLPPNCVHRVLRSNRTVSDQWEGEIGGPEEARALLENEGLSFDELGRADAGRRWVPLPP
jgi:alkylated DNA nucleotide flippase Atl1